jgi:hypothetical protein
MNTRKAIRRMRAQVLAHEYMFDTMVDRLERWAGKIKKIEARVERERRRNGAEEKP